MARIVTESRTFDLSTEEARIVLAVLAVLRGDCAPAPAPASTPGPTPPKADVLTSAATAELLGIKPQTLRAWRLSGRGPAYVRIGKGPGGRVLYRRVDVDAWLAVRRFTSTADETVRAR